MNNEVIKTGLCQPTEPTKKDARVMIDIFYKEEISCPKDCAFCPPKAGDFRRVEILP